jgi:hypothetical protein
MRDYTDYVYACDQTIADGILDSLRALVITMDGDYKTATLQKIRAFVEGGGLLIGLNLGELRDLDEGKDYLDILFGADGGKALGKGKTCLICGQLGAKVEETTTSSNFVIKNTLDGLQAMQREVCDVATAFLAENGVFVSDGIMDGLYTARRNHDGVDTIFTMNYSGKDITRSFTRPDGSVFEEEVKDLAIVEYR